MAESRGSTAHAVVAALQTHGKLGSCTERKVSIMLAGRSSRAYSSARIENPICTVAARNSADSRVAMNSSFNDLKLASSCAIQASPNDSRVGISNVYIENCKIFD